MLILNFSPLNNFLIIIPNDYTFRFFYTISEGLNGAFIKPGIHLVDEARDVFLDYLAETSGWEDRVIQIGRKHQKFEVQPHTILNNK